ncbi:hypothetical protein EW145_g2348 [Phellinidium pouzarii]|uniref:Uncharacterized protein n=1 Tax=Phellinidium pouzarii TaxID=167371 RepID=A0A4S4LCU3_9AGAM|nr:hypothetical protein EW145_g2348 [Phellinidium pouzarii]
MYYLTTNFIPEKGKFAEVPSFVDVSYRSVLNGRLRDYALKKKLVTGNARRNGSMSSGRNALLLLQGPWEAYFLASDINFNISLRKPTYKRPAPPTKMLICRNVEPLAGHLYQEQTRDTTLPAWAVVPSIVMEEPCATAIDVLIVKSETLEYSVERSISSGSDCSLAAVEKLLVCIPGGYDSGTYSLVNESPLGTAFQCYVSYLHPLAEGLAVPALDASCVTLPPTPALLTPTSGFSSTPRYEVRVLHDVLPSFPSHST